jgi:hypothetical protein
MKLSANTLVVLFAVIGFASCAKVQSTTVTLPTPPSQVATKVEVADFSNVHIKDLGIGSQVAFSQTLTSGSSSLYVQNDWVMANIVNIDNVNSNFCYLYPRADELQTAPLTIPAGTYTVSGKDPLWGETMLKKDGLEFIFTCYTGEANPRPDHTLTAAEAATATNGKIKVIKAYQ